MVRWVKVRGFFFRNFLIKEDRILYFFIYVNCNWFYLSKSSLFKNKKEICEIN